MIKNDQYEILKRKIDSVQNSVDTVMSDLSQDRKDIDDLKLRQQQNEVLLKSIVQRFDKFDERQARLIEKTIENSVKPVEKILNRFIRNKKSVLIMRESFNPMKWFKSVFKGFKIEFKKELKDDKPLLAKK